MEDVVREINSERDRPLTLPPDGVLLDEVIGGLQSEWGVPQYPQEYRITIKVGDERGRSEGTNGSAVADARPEASPVREKAPAAPRGAGAGASQDAPAGREGPPKRRRRKGRRRRGTST